MTYTLMHISISTTAKVVFVAVKRYVMFYYECFCITDLSNDVALPGAFKMVKVANLIYI